ncbi:MAG: GDSL-type esterase/lipase family protein [Gemmatimonadaceae bacterium]
MRRFLALGDSYTIGEGVDDTERWPAQLVQELRHRDVEIADPAIIARTGWTTDELAEAIAGASPEGPYALTTLLIGVNDQYRGRALESFASQFEALLQTAIDLAGNAPSRTLVLSIPDWSETPFAEGRDRQAVRRDIDAYNTAVRAQAAAAEVGWVDVTESSREMRRNPALVTADGLHPSGEMYRRWAALLVAPALRALSR